MNQPIVGFHQDSEQHWVAELECGHAQHVRHDPPWMERPWVTTEEGRQSRLGQPLNCVRCDELGQKVAKETVTACQKALIEAYESGGMSGLCAEGRWELAIGALQTLELDKIAQKALKGSAPEFKGDDF